MLHSSHIEITDINNNGVTSKRYEFQTNDKDFSVEYSENVIKVFHGIHEVLSVKNIQHFEIEHVPVPGHPFKYTLSIESKQGDDDSIVKTLVNHWECNRNIPASP